MDKKSTNEILYKEIELIQSCINRMSKNSFSCKGWNLTLIAGIFALVAEGINKRYIYIVILCIDLCFWWMDSFFLMQEQRYRDKYEWVIQKRVEGNNDYLYDLNPYNDNMKINNKKRNQLKTACSKTLLPLYGGIAMLIVVSFFLNQKGAI